MAFTLESEVSFVNQVFDRLSAGQITLAVQTSVPALAAIRHWSTTLNSLIRSYEWPFLTDRTELSIISTLTLETMPTAAWTVGDTITGITSGATADILTVISDSEYDIIYLDGTFEDGETITNATVETVYYNGIEVTYVGETVYWFDSEDAEQAVSELTVATKTPAFEWTYQYELPTDFSRLISIYEDDGSDHPEYRWVREGNRILTDYSTCNIRYVKTVTDPDDFDPLFAEVMLLRMEVKLIPAIPGTQAGQLMAEIKQELKEAEARARVVCTQENNTTGYDSWNLARYS